MLMIPPLDQLIVLALSRLFSVSYEKKRKRAVIELLINTQNLLR